MTFDIPKTMRAVVYRGINDLRLEILPVPDIGPGEILVKVAVCGVCPTDIKKIHHGLLPPPRIYGHETAGTIVKIGGGKTSLTMRPPSAVSQQSRARLPRHSSAIAGATAGEQAAPKRDLQVRSEVLRVGDRVALHHHVPCMTCHFCRHHAFAQCPTYKLTGITAGFEPAGGGYAEYVRVMPFVLPGVVKIPPKNTFEEGAMLEPVNTVLKAVQRLNILPGDRVLVAGQGPIGLMFTRLLKLRGVNVLATDLLESRLKLAKKFGAKWTTLVSAFPSTAGLSGRTQGITPTVRHFKPSAENSPSPGGEGRGLSRHSRATADEGEFSGSRAHEALNEIIPASFDAAIIAVPSDAAVQQALQAIRGGGQILLFAHTKRASQAALKPGEGGSPKSSSSNGFFPLDLATICLDEKDLIGSYSSDFTIQSEVGRIIFSRELDARKLITHRFPLEKTAEAIALAAHPTENSLKIVVTV